MSMFLLFTNNLFDSNEEKQREKREKDQHQIRHALVIYAGPNFLNSISVEQSIRLNVMSH